MPLQILIATLLALVTLGTQLPEKQKKNEITITGSKQGAAEIIKSDSSDIIVITTLKRRSHHITIMGVKQPGSTTHTDAAATAWRINEKNKQHKRNAIARAA
jgi:Lysine/ornithine N-monooxygenase